MGQINKIRAASYTENNNSLLLKVGGGSGNDGRQKQRTAPAQNTNLFGLYTKTDEEK
jgi:hypothetical protein